MRSADCAVARCPSVCHTPVLCSNGAKRVVKLFSTFEFRGVKNRDFRPIRRFISETIQGGTISYCGLRKENRTQAFDYYYFSMILNDPNPDFKVTSLFDAEHLKNGTRFQT